MSDPRSTAAQAALSAAFSRAVDLTALQQPAATTAATGSSSPYVVDVSDATFEEVLQISARIPVVVDLWATWCGPCKQLSPVLEKLAAEGNGTWLLAKVDVDANPAISQAFQVQSIPTVVALAGGRPVGAFSGAQPEPQVRDWITQLLDQLREVLPGIKEAEAAAGTPPPVEPEPADPRFDVAEAATERGDHAAAIDAYTQILADEPDNAEAAGGLAWASLFQRAETAPADAAMGHGQDHTNVDLAIAAADQAAATGELPTAFGYLIESIRVTSGEDRDRLRDHLLSLFALLDAGDPEVIKARRALAAALY